MSFSPSAVHLSDLAVIEASGTDAASFLHGQLSHDILSLEPGQARLAGYCTAKGRLLGTMVVWLAAGAEVPVLRMLIKADIAESVARRLSMFVLRAKVKIAVTQMPVLGITQADTQPAANNALSRMLNELPGQATPLTVTYTEAGDAIAVPASGNGPARWWLTGDDIQPPALDAAALGCWQAADMAAGLPWVVSATQDLFIPQTLNLDLIDGVSFTKGCYPGQEVVARSHYRGTVKRRMAYGIVHGTVSMAASALPGSDTFDGHNPDQPVGRIVNASSGTPAEAGSTSDAATLIHVLMEVQLADLPNAEFRLGSATGPVIEVQGLPYSIQP